ncbi:hypothetical protein F5X99DRAFT_355177 [Biscogniauxia marginata]|nr:hypothetical protein F5X99DRAFT_355177 [Biscogniauxia marginata]
MPNKQCMYLLLLLPGGSTYLGIPKLHVFPSYLHVLITGMQSGGHVDPQISNNLFMSDTTHQQNPPQHKQHNEDGTSLTHSLTHPFS